MRDTRWWRRLLAVLLESFPRGSSVKRLPTRRIARGEALHAGFVDGIGLPTAAERLTRWRDERSRLLSLFHAVSFPSSAATDAEPGWIALHAGRAAPLPLRGEHGSASHRATPNSLMQRRHSCPDVRVPWMPGSRFSSASRRWQQVCLPITVTVQMMRGHAAPRSPGHQPLVSGVPRQLSTSPVRKLWAISRRRALVARQTLGAGVTTMVVGDAARSASRPSGDWWQRAPRIR